VPPVPCFRVWNTFGILEIAMCLPQERLLVPKGRQFIARGVSPWEGCNLMFRAPLGAAERMGSFAPYGALGILARVPGANAPGY
jgi:hypothetical protein